MQPLHGSAVSVCGVLRDSLVLSAHSRTRPVCLLSPCPLWLSAFVCVFSVAYGCARCYLRSRVLRRSASAAPWTLTLPLLLTCSAVKTRATSTRHWLGTDQRREIGHRPGSQVLTRSSCCCNTSSRVSGISGTCSCSQLVHAEKAWLRRSPRRQDRLSLTTLRLVDAVETNADGTCANKPSDPCGERSDFLSTATSSRSWLTIPRASHLTTFLGWFFPGAATRGALHTSRGALRLSG